MSNFIVGDKIVTKFVGDNGVHVVREVKGRTIVTTKGWVIAFAFVRHATIDEVKHNKRLTTFAPFDNGLPVYVDEEERNQLAEKIMLADIQARGIDPSESDSGRLHTACAYYKIADAMIEARQGAGA